MALVVLVSAKGSPGVTTTALALALTWSTPVVLAECDPAGGSILPGYLQGRLVSGAGLLPLAMGALRRTPAPQAGAPAEFWGELVDLSPPHEQRLLLPGLTDPAQAGTVAPMWRWLADVFAGLERFGQSYDVIADCGRLSVPHAPWPLIARADAVLLVAAPTLVSASAAVPAATALRKYLIAQTGTDSALGVVVAGAGPYRAEEIAEQAGAPLVADIPNDRRSVAALTHGGTVGFARPLLRAALDSDRRIRRVISVRRQHVAPRALQGR